MNVLVFGVDGDDPDVVWHVKNAKSENHAMACACEAASGGGELNMDLVLCYCSITDLPATKETDGANRPEPPLEGEWECPKTQS